MADRSKSPVVGHPKALCYGHPEPHLLWHIKRFPAGDSWYNSLSGESSYTFKSCHGLAWKLQYIYNGICMVYVYKYINYIIYTYSNVSDSNMHTWHVPILDFAFIRVLSAAFAVRISSAPVCNKKSTDPSVLWKHHDFPPLFKRLLEDIFIGTYYKWCIYTSIRSYNN